MIARLPIVIELTGIPVGKGRPRFVRATKNVYTPPKTVKFESELKMAGQDAMRGLAPLDGPLSVFMLAEFPVPESWSKKKKKAAIAGEIRPTTKPDADNLMKTLDALKEVCFRDDKQIVDATVKKFYSHRPRLQITINPIPAKSNGESQC